MNGDKWHALETLPLAETKIGMVCPKKKKKDSWNLKNGRKSVPSITKRTNE